MFSEFFPEMCIKYCVRRRQPRLYAHPGIKASGNNGRQRRVEYSIDGQREAIEENDIEGT